MSGLSENYEVQDFITASILDSAEINRKSPTSLDAGFFQRNKKRISDDDYSFAALPASSSAFVIALSAGTAMTGTTPFPSILPELRE